MEAFSSPSIYYRVKQWTNHIINKNCVRQVILDLEDRSLRIAIGICSLQRDHYIALCLIDYIGASVFTYKRDNKVWNEWNQHFFRQCWIKFELCARVLNEIYHMKLGVEILCQCSTVSDFVAFHLLSSWVNVFQPVSI